MTPVIGITTYEDQASWRSWSTRAALLPYVYVDAVRRSAAPAHAGSRDAARRLGTDRHQPRAAAGRAAARHLPWHAGAERLPGRHAAPAPARPGGPRAARGSAERVRPASRADQPGQRAGRDLDPRTPGWLPRGTHA